MALKKKKELIKLFVWEHFYGDSNKSYAKTVLILLRLVTVPNKSQVKSMRSYMLHTCQLSPTMEMNIHWSQVVHAFRGVVGLWSSFLSVFDITL